MFPVTLVQPPSHSAVIIRRLDSCCSKIRQVFMCQVLVWTRYFSPNPHTWLLQGLRDTSPPLPWAETDTTSPGPSEPQPPPSTAKPAVYCNIQGYINYINLHFFFFLFLPPLLSWSLNYIPKRVPK